MLAMGVLASIAGILISRFSLTYILTTPDSLVSMADTYNTDEDWKSPLEDGVHSGVEDVSITATYIMLRAIEMGVYTTWCNYFANSKLEQAFDLPENEKAVLIMPIGYPAEGVVPAPAHAESKDLETSKYR